MKKQEGRKVSLIPTSPSPPNLPFFVSHIIFPGCEISLGYKLSPCIFGEMHFPLDRSVACSADFGGAAVSKREVTLTLSQKIIDSLCLAPVSSAFVFLPPDFHQFLPDKFSSFGRDRPFPSRLGNRRRQAGWKGR